MVPEGNSFPDRSACGAAHEENACGERNSPECPLRQNGYGGAKIAAVAAGKLLRRTRSKLPPTRGTARERTKQACGERNSPKCTLSQNGYGGAMGADVVNHKCLQRARVAVYKLAPLCANERAGSSALGQQICEKDQFCWQ